MATRWYTIQLQQQLLETAAVNLERQGFTSFFPRVELRKNRKMSVIEYMFRGYGFVQIDLEVDRWLSVNGTRGVIGLLPRHSLYPMAMPVGLIEHFQQNDPLPDGELINTFTEYFPGITNVEVDETHQLLSGRRGLVTGLRDRLLQVSFFAAAGQTSNPVWIDREHVRPVDE